MSIFRVISPIGGLPSSRSVSGSEFKPLKVSLQQRSLHVICSRLTPEGPPGLRFRQRVFSPKPEIRGNFWFSVAAKLRVSLNLWGSGGITSTHAAGEANRGESWTEWRSKWPHRCMWMKYLWIWNKSTGHIFQGWTIGASEMGSNIDTLTGKHRPSPESIYSFLRTAIYPVKLPHHHRFLVATWKIECSSWLKMEPFIFNLPQWTVKAGLHT